MLNSIVAGILDLVEGACLPGRPTWRETSWTVAGGRGSLI